MKKIQRIPCVFILFTLFFAVFTPILFVASGTAYAGQRENPLYARLNDSLVKIYEEDVAHEPVISALGEQDIDRLAKKHGFSIKKTKALIILSDLSFRVDEPTPFADLAEMKDREIVKFGKHLFDLYGKTLSKEEKKALKEKALAALKSN